MLTAVSSYLNILSFCHLIQVSAWKKGVSGWGKVWAMRRFEVWLMHLGWLKGLTGYATCVMVGPLSKGGRDVASISCCWAPFSLFLVKPDFPVNDNYVGCWSKPPNGSLDPQTLLPFYINEGAACPLAIQIRQQEAVPGFQHRSTLLLGEESQSPSVEMKARYWSPRPD